MINESLPELIRSATHMLMDRSEPERELIYYVCKLEDEERDAIILAYKKIRMGEEE